MEGSQQANYMFGNSVLLDNKTFIENKKGNLSYTFTFYYMGRYFGVWYNRELCFVSTDYDPSYKTIFSFTLDDHSQSTTLLRRANNSTIFKKFIEYYKKGLIRFETQMIKNIVYEILKRVL